VSLVSLLLPTFTVAPDSLAPVAESVRIPLSVPRAPLAAALMPRWLATTRVLPSEGEFTTPEPDTHMAELPPPSRLSALYAPSPFISVPTSLHFIPTLKPACRPSMTAT